MKKAPALILCAMCLLSLPAEARKKEDDKKYALAMTEYEKSLVMDSNLAIALVEIKEIPNEPWTNGNPPRPTLKILKLLKGGEHPWNMKAVWQPLPYDAAWAGKDANDLLQKWKAKPMEAPKKESEWYVTGELKDKVFYVAPIARYPASKDAYETLSDMAAKSMKDNAAADATPIVEMAAYGERIKPWAAAMEKGNLPELAKRADLVALVTLGNMKSEERLVEFTIKTILKRPALLSASTQNVKLMGLPDSLYEVLYACNKTPEQGFKEFLILMNVKQTEGEKPSVYFAPVHPAYAIQPATAAKLKLLGFTE